MAEATTAEAIGSGEGSFAAWSQRIRLWRKLAYVLAGLAVVSGVATVITWTGRNLFLRAYHDLIDTRLSNEEEDAIRGVLDEHAGAFLSYSDLRTRRSGRSRLVDLNVMVPRVESVARAHDLVDMIEAGIHEALPGSIVTIHIDPCEGPRGRCDAECPAASLPLCRATQSSGEPA